jgi:type III pantothenate kinase
MDRLVAAFAAKTFLPKVRIIIDFGTAITFDILSKEGDYQGGLILPGIGSTLKAFSYCALLPKRIRVKKVTSLIPRQTDASIAKGVEEGFSAMINSLVIKYKKIMKLSAKEAVIVTGGDAHYIMPNFNFPYVYAPELVMKGIFILGQRLLLPEIYQKKS